MKLTVDLADPNEVAEAHRMLADALGVTAIPGSAVPQAPATPTTLHDALREAGQSAHVAPPAPTPAAPPAPAPAPAAPAPAAPAPAAPAPAPAAPAPAPAPAAPPPPAQPAPAPAPAPAPGSITQAEFAAKVQAYAKAHGPKAAKNFLASKGFANTQAVTPDWFPHLVAEMGV